jgi:hypothetical protein
LTRKFLKSLSGGQAQFPIADDALRSIDENQQEDDGKRNFLHPLRNMQSRAADLNALLKGSQKAANGCDGKRAHNGTGQTAQAPNNKHGQRQEGHIEPENADGKRPKKMTEQNAADGLLK